MYELGIYKQDGVTFFEWAIINPDVIDEIYRMMLKTTIFNKGYFIERVYNVAWWNDEFGSVYDNINSQINVNLNARYLLYYSSLNPPEISPTIKGMYYVFFKNGFKYLSMLEGVEDERVIQDTIDVGINDGACFDYDYLGVINFYKKHKTEPCSPFNTIKLSNKKI